MILNFAECLAYNFTEQIKSLHKRCSEWTHETKTLQGFVSLRLSMHHSVVIYYLVINKRILECNSVHYVENYKCIAWAKFGIQN